MSQSIACQADLRVQTSEYTSILASALALACALVTCPYCFSATNIQARPSSAVRLFALLHSYCFAEKCLLSGSQPVLVAVRHGLSALLLRPLGLQETTLGSVYSGGRLRREKPATVVSVVMLNACIMLPGAHDE